MGNCCTKNNTTIGPDIKKNTNVENAKKKNRTPYNNVVGDEEEETNEEEEDEEDEEEEENENDEDADGDTNNTKNNGEKNNVIDGRGSQNNPNEQSASDSKQVKKESVSSPMDITIASPLVSSPQINSLNSQISLFQFQIDSNQSQSQSQSQISSPRANKTKAIATNFGLTIGIELDDIASFLDDILRKDIQRKDSTTNNDTNVNRDGMERIWEGCIGKNKANINNNSDLAKLLYKLTYVTLNTYQKNNKNNNNNNDNNADNNNNNKPKAKPDHKSIELAIVPLKQAILEMKYNNVYNNNSIENNNNIINAEFEITQEDFKRSFSKYLVRASEILQQSEQIQQLQQSLELQQQPQQL